MVLCLYKKVRNILHINFYLRKISHKKKLINLIIQEMHWFSYQFPILLENATKPIVCGKPWKLVLILFLQYGCFFLIRFTGILWYVSAYGKCIGFSNDVPQHRKMQQNRLYGEKLRNQGSYFPHICVLFSHPVPIL